MGDDTCAGYSGRVEGAIAVRVGSACAKSGGEEDGPCASCTNHRGSRVKENTETMGGEHERKSLVSIKRRIEYERRKRMTDATTPTPRPMVL